MVNNYVEDDYITLHDAPAATNEYCLTGLLPLFVPVSRCRSDLSQFRTDFKRVKFGTWGNYTPVNARPTSLFGSKAVVPVL
jgi:hypothetical protein